MDKPCEHPVVLRGLTLFICIVLSIGSALPPIKAAEESKADGPDWVDPELLKHVHPLVRYKRILLPDDQNAYLLWSQAFQELVGIKDPQLSESMCEALEEDSPFPSEDVGSRLKEWIEQNDRGLQLIDAGLKRGKCQFPEIRTFEDWLPDMSALRRCARMKLLRAKAMAAERAFDAALRELRKLLLLGEMTQKGEGGVIHYLVGIPIQKMGLMGVRWLAAQEDVSESVLSGMISALPTDWNFAGDLAKTVCVDFFAVYPHLLDVFPADLGEWERLFINEDLGAHPKALDKAETLKIASSYYARHIKNTSSFWPARDRKVNKDAELEVKLFKIELAPVMAVLRRKGEPLSDETRAQAQKYWAKSENPGGKIILMSVLPSVFDKVLEISFGARAEREATRTIVALRLYWMRKGELPDSLDELIEEKILKDAPMDPFADKPLRYSREKRRIWSVGPDEVDDGGKGEPMSLESKDYIFLIPEFP